MSTATLTRVTRPRKPPSDKTYGGRFALRLTWLRTEAGFDMEQAAKAISKAGHPISVSGLYKLEAMSRSVDIDAYPAIAKAYHVPISMLLPSK